MKRTGTLLTVCLSVLLLLVLVLPMSAAVALPYQSKMSANMPTDTFGTDGALNVTFHGNWDAVTYPRNNYTPEARKILNSLINITTVNGKETASDAFWGVEGATHGWYTEVRARGGNAYWGGASSLNTPATYIGGWRYTAEYSGLVTLSFGALRQIESTVPVYVAAFVNGKMVWPTVGGTVYDADAENPYAAWQVIGSTTSVVNSFNGNAMLAGHYLAEGDEVEFLIAGNGSCNQNKAVVQPIVTYTEFVEAPKFSKTEVALGEAFAVNLRFDPASIHAQATNLGAYINGEFVLAVDGCVRVDGIAAKNLVDEIKAAPAYTLGGTELRGEEITVTPAALLGNYVTGEYSAEVKALAAATLDYAAAAQMYFEYKSEGLEPAKKEYAYTGTYESAMKIKGNEENNVATPYAATLLLGDTVSFKFIFTAAAEGFAENYRFALLDADGKVVKTVAPVLCEGQTNTYKAIFEGIMPTMWNKVYTVAVIAANDTAAQPTAIGETVDYSVISYLVRASAKSDNPVLASDVAPAMYALYEAAVAYLNAQK